jgi:hypothetical protein
LLRCLSSHNTANQQLQQFLDLCLHLRIFVLVGINRLFLPDWIVGDSRKLDIICATRWKMSSASGVAWSLMIFANNTADRQLRQFLHLCLHLQCFRTSVLLVAAPFGGKGLLRLATGQRYEIIDLSGGDALASPDQAQRHRGGWCGASLGGAVDYILNPTLRLKKRRVFVRV